MSRSRPTKGGEKRKPGVGTRPGTSFNKGPGMDKIVEGEAPPADPAAEIEARRSDAPDDQLPPDAQARRKGE